jgi:predicted nucleic acid-binding protein
MVADTGIFIEHLRSKNKLSTTLYKISENKSLYISSVTLYELYMGATTEAKQRDVKLIIGNFTILPFTDVIATRAAMLYHHLRLSNKMIEFRDLFIAATCITHELPIVTLNKKKHFDRIDELEIISF